MVFWVVCLYFHFHDTQPIHKQEGQTLPLCGIHHGHFWKWTQNNGKVGAERNMITDVSTNLF